MNVEKFHRQSFRRVAVIVAVASIALFVFWSISQRGPALGVVSLLLFGIALWHLNASIGSTFKQSEWISARRQEALSKAFRLSHVVTSALLILALAYSFMMSRDGFFEWSNDGRLTLALFGLLALIHPYVPWVILAWTEPDAVMEDPVSLNNR